MRFTDRRLGWVSLVGAMLEPMEWVRFDVSRVRPQGGYVAKQCPVRAQWDVLRPAEPSEPSDAARRRMQAGNDFEADVFAELARTVAGAVLIERGGADDRPDREQRTLAAMESGAPVIIGGRLPVDEIARRVGEPDVLVTAEDGGYRPVDVKHHATLTEKAGPPARVTGLDEPTLHAIDVLEDQYARKHKGDLFQLAHYRRMLQACGHAAPSGWGAIIGTERVVTWYDLDAEIWRTPSLSEGQKLRSTMEVYDFEFAFRLDIIEIARRHRDDPSAELLVVPVRTGECGECPWWGHCEELLTDRGDVSLLPGSTWKKWTTHRTRGVHTLTGLASLDWRTAELSDRGVDLVDLLAKIDNADDDTPIAEIISRTRHVQVRKLADAGVHTAGDARRLDTRAATYAGASFKDLAESIDLARARLADEPVFRRRNIEHVEVHRADVEVDLDLENVDAGVYLWGAFVTDQGETGLVDEGYRSFVTWDPDPTVDEVEIFEQLCRWLDDLRRTLRAAGHSVGIYCYNEKVEAGAMRRLAGSPRTSKDWTDWVDELVASPEWVDLLAVARQHLITGAGMGLKHLAPLAGFGWDDDDPGGEQSMEWHRIAVTDLDPAARTEHRERILTYNRNDVEATLALRTWMTTAGPALPRLEALDVDAGRGCR